MARQGNRQSHQNSQDHFVGQRDRRSGLLDLCLGEGVSGELVSAVPDSSAPAADDASPSALANMFRALRHRNYKLFFSGQLVSLVGSFLTLTATSWLVLRMTHSAKWLGIVAFAGQIPLFFLLPVA